jgi:hypothetical protein
VPVKPLLHAAEMEYGMFEHFKRYPWVLELYRYQDIDSLTANFKTCVLEPLENKLACR